MIHWYSSSTLDLSIVPAVSEHSPLPGAIWNMVVSNCP
jgi:hypothetical protein